jgi:hypothetical protein
MQLTRSATIPCTRSHDEHLCHACQLGCYVRLPFSSSSLHATHAFDLVHCDLWTSPITSMSGYKYYLVVLDNFSHYVWTFPLRAKSEAFPALRHFFTWVSTQFGLTIKAIQCDNGQEFDNSTSRDFFLSHVMQLRMSYPYTSSQNGKAERMIRMTNDTIRTFLLQAHLPARFWAEGLHTSTYVLNHLPSTVCLAPTPHQALFGTPLRYDHLRVFGCACYPNTAATAPHKIAPCSTLCVFLGYSPDHKGNRCFDLSSRRVLISRHVVFDEFVFPYSTTTTPPSSDPDLDLFTLFPIDVVVEPPILPLSAGTRSPHVGPTPGPVPCLGLMVSPTVVSPLHGAGRAAPAVVPAVSSSSTPRPSGGGGIAPPAGPLVPTPPARALRPAGARLPAPAAAAGVRTTTVAVPTGDLSSGGTAGGPVPARDTNTSTAATRGTCRDAGVPPTAPSPRPTARPPDGDMTRGWYPAAPNPGGHTRGLTDFSGTLLRPHRPAGPPLASGNGGGVRCARRQPNVGSGAPSARRQCHHRQVDLDAQAAGRWYPGATQGLLGS